MLLKLHESASFSGPSCEHLVLLGQVHKWLFKCSIVFDEASLDPHPQ